MTVSTVHVTKIKSFRRRWGSWFDSRGKLHRTQSSEKLCSFLLGKEASSKRIRSVLRSYSRQVWWKKEVKMEKCIKPLLMTAITHCMENVWSLVVCQIQRIKALLSTNLLLHPPLTYYYFRKENSWFFIPIKQMSIFCNV